MTTPKARKKPRASLGLFPERPEADTAVNREPRVTVSINIDITSSLSAVWLVYLAALQRMFEECGKHPAARTSAFVSIGLCGSRFSPTPYLPFSKATLPEFEPQGGSPGALWINSSVKHLRAEHERMKADAVASNKDVWMLITDGHFDDGEAAFNEAVEAYRTLEREKKGFNGFIVLVGERPNFELAARISKARPPFRLDELKVDELFHHVSIIVQRASMSRPGESVKVPPPNWELSDGDR